MLLFVFTNSVLAGCDLTINIKTPSRLQIYLDPALADAGAMVSSARQILLRKDLYEKSVLLHGVKGTTGRNLLCNDMLNAGFVDVAFSLGQREAKLSKQEALAYLIRGGDALLVSAADDDIEQLKQILPRLPKSLQNYASGSLPSGNTCKDVLLIEPATKSQEQKELMNSVVGKNCAVLYSPSVKALQQELALNQMAAYKKRLPLEKYRCQ